VHGGAGTIKRSSLTPELEAAYRAGIEEALRVGWKILSSGGTATDATQAAVVSMENSELFNAGKGAVFTHDGKNEQDACIMNGADRSVGAVAAVRKIRNPIMAARMVLDYSDHVLLAGEGAEQFVASLGMELENDPKYFYTERRWGQLQKAIAKENTDAKVTTTLDHSEDPCIGTVGAVALDANGNLAAATSTGGMTNKRFGRIGDTPLVGAGTFADNENCAVSATGVGEFFVRGMTCHTIAMLRQYKGMSLIAAAEQAVMVDLTKLGGYGGAIAVDRKGEIAMSFNSDGMYRGWVGADGSLNARIFRSE
jgi:beta-aspartyl-peptidase (threonine type)